MSHRVRRFLPAKQTNHGKPWEEQNIHSRAHTLVAWAPLFTVNSQCPLEGHWLFCCITDRNLVWKASKRHLSCNTGKKKGLFMSADSLWILTNISEQNVNACGFVDRECESIWGSPGADWTSYVRPLFLYFSSLFQIVIVLPWHSQCCTALRSVVPLSGLSMWTGQPRLLKMDAKMFDSFFFFFPRR